jgi:hypothetical protein
MLQSNGIRFHCHDPFNRKTWIARYFRCCTYGPRKSKYDINDDSAISSGPVPVGSKRPSPRTLTYLSPKYFHFLIAVSSSTNFSFENVLF